MAGKALLDTNAVIALLANDAALRAVLDGAKIYVPAVVLGEMYYGAFKSAQVKRISIASSASCPTAWWWTAMLLPPFTTDN